MDPLSSSSGDAFDSMGFNEFMNAQGSSDEERSAARLPARRNAGVFNNAKHGDMYSGGAVARNPYSSYGSAPAADPYSFGGGGLSGDPYSFNIDFSAVKAPPKKLPEPSVPEPGKAAVKVGREPAAKKEVSFENADSLTSILTASRPKTLNEKPKTLSAQKAAAPEAKAVPAKSQFADMMSEMMKDIKSLKEEEEDEPSEKDEAFLASEESYEDVQTGPSQKVVNWSDIKKEVLNQEDRQEIEDSIRDSEEKPVEQPISLVRKFGEDRKQPMVESESEVSESYQEDYDASESNSSPGPIIKSEPFRIPGAKPVIEVKTDPPQLIKPLEVPKSEPVSLPPPVNVVETAPAKPENLLAKAELWQPPVFKPTEGSARQPIRPELLQPQPQPAAVAEQERPPLISLSPTISSQIPAPRKVNLSLSRESNEFIFGRLPQLKSQEYSNQLSDLHQRLTVLQDQLESKQQRIFELERERVQTAFSKLEGDALDKTKTTLREANHKLELYHIEIEQLIKQVDFSDARIKDLEAENAGLQKTVEAKNKQIEERQRGGETRAEERTLRESNRMLSLEKEQWVEKIDTLEKDLAYYKDLSSRLEKETAELRVRLQRFHDQSSEVDELKRQVYLLTVQLQDSQQAPPQPSSSPHSTIPMVFEDLSTEENRVKILREVRTQEALIRGYQRENERLVEEMKQLKEHLASEHRRMYAENKKVESLKTTLIKEHGGLLIKEGISDLTGINDLAGGTVISREEIAQLRERAARLDRELREKTLQFHQTESEMHTELDRLRKFKQDAECRLAGAAPVSVYSDVADTTKEYESKLREAEKRHSTEVQALNDKIRWYIENQDLIDTKNKEIESLRTELEALKERMTSAKPTSKESARLKELEKVNKLLEDQLKEKDPNSVAALIRAAKPSPEENAQMQALQAKIEELTREVSDKDAEYESKIRSLRQEYDTFRVKSETKGKSKAAKPRDSVTDLRIKELEKQVEDTKAYYLKRMRDKAPGAPEPVLAPVLAQKNREIESLQSQLALQKDSTQSPGALFAFLSSAVGLLWSQIVHHLSALRSAIDQRNVRGVAEVLDQLLTVLDSGTTGKSLPQFQAVGQITDRCMDISSLIAGKSIDWGHLKTISDGLSLAVDQEMWRQVSPAKGVALLGRSESVSVFDDQNYDAEGVEERLALSAVDEIQPQAGRLVGFPTGAVPAATAFEFLSGRLGKVEELKLRAFVRLLLGADGLVSLEEVSGELRGKNASWWKQRLRESAFAVKTKTKGLTLSPSLDKWLSQGAVFKVHSHISTSHISLDDLISQLFDSLSTLSLASLRAKFLTLSVPLTRDDLRAIFQAMDSDRDGLISRSDLIQILRPKPKVAWGEETVQQPQSLKPQSDSDPRLAAANARIKELESLLLRQKDNQPTNVSTEGHTTAKVAGLEEELGRMKTKWERMREESERVKLERDRLEAHIQRTPAAPGTADLIALQRKIELIEESHFRREQHIKTQLDSLALSKEQELQQLKKKHEGEVSSLQRIITNKSLEIDGFKTELDGLLLEVARLTRGSKK